MSGEFLGFGRESVDGEASTPVRFVPFVEDHFTPSMPSRAKAVQSALAPDGRGVVQANPAALGAMLCWATHPIAQALGTTPPLVPCCRHCAIYPQHPTAETWPS